MADPKPKLGSNMGNAGKGRPKGVPNKVTGQLKEMILAALEGAGGVEYLQAQAHESPAAFLALIGKILPMQLTGDVNNPVAITEIVRTIVRPK